MSRNKAVHIVELNTENHKLIVKWDCPRCQHNQTSVVENLKILEGVTVTCQNTAVCGEGNSSFTIRGVNISHVTYADPQDVPLK